MEADVKRQIDTDRLIREQELMVELNRLKWSKVIKTPQEIQTKPGSAAADGLDRPPLSS